MEEFEKHWAQSCLGNPEANLRENCPFGCCTTLSINGIALLKHINKGCPANKSTADKTSDQNMEILFNRHWRDACIGNSDSLRQACPYAEYGCDVTIGQNLKMRLKKCQIKKCIDLQNGKKTPKRVRKVSV